MFSNDLDITNRAEPNLGKHLVILILGACTSFLVLLSIFWVGFLGSDDSLYWAGAGGWLREFPYVGDSHWTLRHTLVIPMAIARLVVGDGMAAMVTPIILYALGIIIVVGVWVGRNCGTLASAAALALIITNPQFLLLSSSAYIDIVETFYLVSGLAIFHEAIKRDGSLLLTLCSGVLVGLAMLSRETTALAVFAIVILFMAGFGVSRWKYFVIGAGFLLPVGLEFVWLWRATGILFYRSNIAIHHDSTIDRWSAQGSAVPLVHPALDPFIMLLLNHNFALLFWIGPPFVIWLLRQATIRKTERQLFVLASVIAAVWTLTAAFLWSLLPLTPRYYFLPSVLLALLTGVAIVKAWTAHYRKLCFGVIGLALSTNLVAVSLDNRHYMWGEHELVEVVREGQSLIHTSTQTLRRAQLLLVWSDVTSKVVDTPPAPGDLYYYDPTRAEGSLHPGPKWSVVQKIMPPESAGQWVLGRIVKRDDIPAKLWALLGPGHPPVIIYRVE